MGCRPAPAPCCQGPLDARASSVFTHYESRKRQRDRCPPEVSLALSLGIGLERTVAIPWGRAERISAGRITQLFPLAFRSDSRWGLEWVFARRGTVIGSRLVRKPILEAN